MTKINEKEKAIKLRQNGLTYSEILKEVNVSKSTLSLWLRSVGLSQRQKQRITLKKIQSRKKANRVWRQMRIDRTKQIKNKARSEIQSLSERESWLIGIALYWAEGAKEKPHGKLVSTKVVFSNSDPQMILFFHNWIIKFLDVKKRDIIYDLYIHENHKDRLKDIKKYWDSKADIDVIHHVYFKKHTIKTNRKKVDKNNYFGQIRISVRKSTDLNRKIQGWCEGIINSLN